MKHLTRKEYAEKMEYYKSNIDGSSKEWLIFMKL